MIVRVYTQGFVEQSCLLNNILTPLPRKPRIIHALKRLAVKTTQPALNIITIRDVNCNNQPQVQKP